MMANTVIQILLAYLLGSVSGSLLLGRLKGVDIRTMGSGNAGGTNALRTQGFLFALGVVVIDVGKGALAAWAMPRVTLLGDGSAWSLPVMALVCGFAAILGHCYPLFHGFRGGKGAGTAVGVLSVVAPWILAPMLVVWLLVLIASGYVGLATISAGLSLIPAAWRWGDQPLFIFAVVTAVFLVYTHRSNLVRLRNGTENRFEKVRFWKRRLD